MGYFDFRRGSSYSAGVVNTNSPKQLRIGFGTNNPTNKWYFYSMGGSNDDILLEGDDYPFLILKSKIGAANEGILFKSSNDNNIGILFHSGADKTMRWGFGDFTNDVVIDSTTRNVGFETSTPSSKLYTLNDRVTSLA